jgi:hypothetical protein
MIEKRDGNYYVRDLSSTLGTIVNGESIGDYCRSKDAPLRAGDNDVIAGGVGSPFVFSVFIGWKDPKAMAGFEACKDAFPRAKHSRSREVRLNSAR